MKRGEGNNWKIEYTTNNLGDSLHCAQIISDRNGCEIMFILFRFPLPEGWFQSETVHHVYFSPWL